MRVLIQQGGWVVGQRVSLEDDEAHHLKVRRARDGDEVDVLDGAGFRGRGVLVQAGRDWAVEIRAGGVEPQAAPFTLAVAAGDRDRFSWVVEKAVELGVTRIIPLETNRTLSVATRLKETHLPRLRRAALETTKQCGAAWVLQLEDPMRLEMFALERLSGSGWLADQDGAPAPAQLDGSGISVVIGPEGGLTESERETLISAGYRQVALGRHTLRFETAAVAAAAAVTQARMRGSNG